MDFDQKFFVETGYGHYERLPKSCLTKALPLLFLAYCGEPSDSGTIHSDVKARYNAGDPQVIAKMQQIAQVAEDARHALLEGDKDTCRSLMAHNFSLRRQLFGDEVLGQSNLELVNIAANHGGVAKLPGSGGAVVGTCEDSQLDAVRAAYEAAGYVFTVIEPHFGPHDTDEVFETQPAETTQDQQSSLSHNDTVVHVTDPSLLLPPSF
mmetsp:Transcript_19864/g.24090  ORF Transcript_19864/g.24090 Transcript_19864/m.24090 type:complete len:208 (+) Transcript_19864:46-669(+)